MKQILFITIPEKGHLNPMVGPAVYLQQRGHQVVFYAAQNITAQLDKVGLTALPATAPPSVPLDKNRGALFARQVRDPTWLRNWIKELLITNTPAQVAPIQAAIRQVRPDLIVADPMIYAAAMAAHREGVPWVALSNSLNPVLDQTVQSDLLATLRWLAPARDQLFAAYGLRPRFSGCDLLSPWLTIAFTTQELIGREVPDVHLVGPSLPPRARGDETDFPWDKLNVDQPILYASFGSQIYYQPEIFQLLIRTTLNLKVQLILSVSQLHQSTELHDLPPHVLTTDYAPQLQLLPKVSGFITHGGANSVMEAIHFGVPILVSPVCNDQFHQAHYIQRSGIGVVRDLHQANEAECKTTLERVLHDPEIRRDMRRVSASYQRDGAAEAAALIEGLL